MVSFSDITVYDLDSFCKRNFAKSARNIVATDPMRKMRNAMHVTCLYIGIYD